MAFCFTAILPNIVYADNDTVLHTIHVEKSNSFGSGESYVTLDRIEFTQNHTRLWVEISNMDGFNEGVIFHAHTSKIIQDDYKLDSDYINHSQKQLWVHVLDYGSTINGYIYLKPATNLSLNEPFIVEINVGDISYYTGNWIGDIDSQELDFFIRPQTTSDSLNITLSKDYEKYMNTTLEIESEIINQLNEFRNKNEVTPFISNTLISDSERSHMADLMIRDYLRFTHCSYDYYDYDPRTDYSFRDSTNYFCGYDDDYYDVHGSDFYFLYKQSTLEKLGLRDRLSLSRDHCLSNSDEWRFNWENEFSDTLYFHHNETSLEIYTTKEIASFAVSDFLQYHSGGGGGLHADNLLNFVHTKIGVGVMMDSDHIYASMTIC